MDKLQRARILGLLPQSSPHSLAPNAAYKSAVPEVCVLGMQNDRNGSLEHVVIDIFAVSEVNGRSVSAPFYLY